MAGTDSTVCIGLQKVYLSAAAATRRMIKRRIRDTLASPLSDSETDFSNRDNIVESLGAGRLDTIATFHG